MLNGRGDTGCRVRGERAGCRGGCGVDLQYPYPPYCYYTSRGWHVFSKSSLKGSIGLLVLVLLGPGRSLHLSLHVSGSHNPSRLVSSAPPLQTTNPDQARNSPANILFSSCFPLALFPRFFKWYTCWYRWNLEGSIWVQKSMGSTAC